MSIFDQEPEDWNEFQNLVAQLFVEIDCEVKVEERIKLVRGEKEIDVWVRDPHTTPPSIYLCECKHWNKPIPQEVIHSFRTVLSDYGAHRGFLISRVGFQAGAKEAIKNTNLDLVTFTELQSIFFPRWRVAMGKRFMPYADRLFPYWDYPGKRPKIEWNKQHVERQNLLYKAYYPLVHLGPSFENEGSVWELPMTLPALDLNGLRSGNVILCTYRQVYDFIDNNKDIALKHFQVLFGEIEA
ncbi:restriction endonuclease [Desulfobulbus sp.]|uniref:restriction endonuclease n=1 Tax=Desulfobulbus sp. TaxID=895 RepID=UPI0027BA7B1F|nr:restriction endonuclease [Desulfobulbus sp.]